MRYLNAWCPYNSLQKSLYQRSIIFAKYQRKKYCKTFYSWITKITETEFYKCSCYLSVIILFETRLFLMWTQFLNILDISTNTMLAFRLILHKIYAIYKQNIPSLSVKLPHSKPKKAAFSLVFAWYQRKKILRKVLFLNN